MTYIAKPKLRHPAIAVKKLGFTHRDYEGSVSTLCAGCGHDSISNITVDSDRLATAATVNGTPVIEDYANDRTADQYSVGWNGKWDNHEGWHALADLSWSRTDRTDNSLQTTAGLGRAVLDRTPPARTSLPRDAVLDDVSTDLRAAREVLAGPL